MDAQSNHSASLLVTSGDTVAPNRLVSELRMAGMAPDIGYADSVEALSSHLNAAVWDVLVCFDSGKLSIARVLETLQQHDTDLPVVVAAEDSTQDQALLQDHRVVELLRQSEHHRLMNAIRRESTCRKLQRNLAAARIRQEEADRQCLALLDESPIAYAFLRDGIHLYCNTAYANLFGYPDTCNIMTLPALDLFAAEDRERLRGFLVSLDRTTASIDLSGRRKNGDALHLSLKITASSFREQTCLQVRADLGTGNSPYREKIGQLATRDLLTRLENPAGFSARIERAIHKAVTRHSFSALMVVELNEFIDLGSTIGRANANMVLNDIAGWLQQKIRMPYAAARLDRHVFGLLLYESNTARAIALAQEIRSQVSSRISVPIPGALKLSCSIGIALINDDSRDAASVLARARTRVHQSAPLTNCSDPDKQDDADMLDVLTVALKENRFRLAFQPVVQVRAGSPLGYEVLCRMLDRQNNEIMPAGFLWLANLNGLGERLDRLVFSRALDLLPGLERGLDLTLKITHNSLTSLTFLPWLSAQLASRRIPANRVVIEISEIDFHSAPEQGQAFCRGLHELGTRISICHFGCALDPDGTLGEIKPALAKFDVTLVRDIIYSMQQKHNLAAMISTLHDRQIKVIASHTEDMDALPALWDIGTDYAQGYCLKAPSGTMDYAFAADRVITLKATSQ